MGMCRFATFGLSTYQALLLCSANERERFAVSLLYPEKWQFEALQHSNVSPNAKIYVRLVGIIFVIHTQITCLVVGCDRNFLGCHSSTSLFSHKREYPQLMFQTEHAVCTVRLNHDADAYVMQLCSFWSFWGTVSQPNGSDRAHISKCPPLLSNWLSWTSDCQTCRTLIISTKLRLMCLCFRQLIWMLQWHVPPSVSWLSAYTVHEFC